MFVRGALLMLGLVGCDYVFRLDQLPDLPTPSRCPVRNVATGRGHTCTVTSDGVVACWGDNASGQVSPSAAASVLSPEVVALPGPAQQVSAGRDHTCARLDDGAVWCWGRNQDGALGLGSMQPSTTGPLQIMGIDPSAEIGAGGRHTCSRSAVDGSISCWGTAEHFEAAQMPTETCDMNRPCIAPTRIAGTEGSKQLVVGHRHACVVTATDQLACWGRNDNGQTGRPLVNKATMTPTVVATLGEVRRASAAGRYTCAIDTLGLVKCWGDGYTDQLGNGTFDSSESPVTARVTDAQDLALGGWGGCALQTGGTVTCWGDHDSGDGTPGIELSPATTSITNVTSLASHFYHSCAVVDDELRCWGDDAWGQLGRGSRSLRPSPVDVPTIAGATGLAVGDRTAFAIAGGKLYAWGENGYGEVARDDFQSALSPVEIVTGLPGTLSDVRAGYSGGCVRDDGGRAACWGRAYNGRLGTGANTRAITTPSAVAVNGFVTDLALGREHMCVLASSQVTCFGYNDAGQLGVAATTTSSTTGVDPGLSNVTRIAAGERFSCAALGSGELRCWGRNGNGQLGDGSTTDRFSPVKPTLPAVTKVVAGSAHVCALTTASEIYCWGANSSGQLGLGDYKQRETPTKLVLPGEIANELVAGGDGTCALTVSGRTYCWGDSNSGQLGLGTLSSWTTPQLVTAYNNGGVAMGSFGSCAIVGGTVRCAGRAEIAGAGDNSRSLPAPVVGLPACTK